MKSARRSKAVLDEARGLPRFLRRAFFVIMRLRGFRWRGVNCVPAFGRYAVPEMRRAAIQAVANRPQKNVGSFVPQVENTSHLPQRR